MPRRHQPWFTESRDELEKLGAQTSVVTDAQEDSRSGRSSSAGHWFRSQNGTVTILRSARAMGKAGPSGQAPCGSLYIYLSISHGSIMWNQPGFHPFG